MSSRRSVRGWEALLVVQVGLECPLGGLVGSGVPTGGLVGVGRPSHRFGRVQSALPEVWDEGL